MDSDVKDSQELLEPKKIDLSPMEYLFKSAGQTTPKMGDFVEGTVSIKAIFVPFRNTVPSTKSPIFIKENKRGSVLTICGNMRLLLFFSVCII